MTTPFQSRKPALSRRGVLLTPAVLLTLLVIMPWALRFLEHHWAAIELGYFREIIDSIIALLLGAWVLHLIWREQRVAEAHLQELELLSLTDPLTGLSNRRALERDIEGVLSRARRMDAPLSLLYMDVNHLKLLNDHYGHARGDEVLKCLSAVLRSSSRLGVDTAYRVGGDEFVMLLGADRAGAEATASRIAAMFKDRSGLGATVSMGVVLWDGAQRASELLDLADTRMYREKHHDPLLQGA
jgi:diguanylate cyclase (GGDEF)-like protein